MPDLMEYLPGIYREIKEFKAMATAESPETDAVFEALEEIMEDQFAGELQESGCKRWENMLTIEPLDTDTLDVRRFRILSRLNEQPPFTWRTLQRKLGILCGENGYRLEMVKGDYRLIVKIELGVKKKFEEVRQLMDRVLPSNLILDVDLLYNTHAILSGFTHAQLAAYTHRELREEVLH